jgi:hypothetical protein
MAHGQLAPGRSPQAEMEIWRPSRLDRWHVARRVGVSSGKETDTMTDTTRIALALSLASLVAACGYGNRSTSDRIGAAGGTLATASGITLRVPAGALSRETEVRLVETQPRDGAMAHVEVEPHGLQLASKASLSFKVEDGNVKVTEIEHGAQGEIRHQLEKHRHGASGEIEIQVEHLAEVELEHGLTCSTVCGAGLECDDGVCKAHLEDDPATHDVGDDQGTDDPAIHDVGDDQGGTTIQPGDDKGQGGQGHT